MSERPFVEIKCTGNASGGNATYRFYGYGEWDVDDGRGFGPINGIYVPADVLKIAAEQCEKVIPKRDSD
jgi:hypothetical protein